jgi:hypothetical protein
MASTPQNAEIKQHIKTCVGIMREFIDRRFPTFKEFRVEFAEYQAASVLYEYDLSDWTPEQSLEFFLDILECNLDSLLSEIKYFGNDENAKNLPARAKKVNESVPMIEIIKQIVLKTKEFVQNDITRLRAFVQQNVADFGSLESEKAVKVILDEEYASHQSQFLTLYSTLFEELKSLRGKAQERAIIIKEKVRSLIRVPEGMTLYDGGLRKRRYFDRYGNEV